MYACTDLVRKEDKNSFKPKWTAYAHSCEKSVATILVMFLSTLFFFFFFFDELSKRESAIKWYDNIPIYSCVLKLSLKCFFCLFLIIVYEKEKKIVG